MNSHANPEVMLLRLQSAAESIARADQHRGQRQLWQSRKADMKAELSEVRQQLEEAKEQLAALAIRTGDGGSHGLNGTGSSKARLTAVKQVGLRGISSKHSNHQMLKECNLTRA